MSRPLRALLGVFAGDVRRHPASSLASVAAIAAGVAVFVAIALAGSAARSSFVDTVNAIAGRATHEVTRAGGLAEERFAELAVLDGVEAAQPVVAGRVGVLERERDGSRRELSAPPLYLLGIDPFRAAPFLGEVTADGQERVIGSDEVDRFVTEPATVVVPRVWAEEAGVEAGDKLEVVAAGRRLRLDVIEIYELEVLGEAARDTALVDIATAQEVFDRVGRMDRVDLIVSDGAEEAVSARLAAGERFERPDRRGDRVARMMEAFRLNIQALGGLALVVGSLLVFSAAQFTVVRRMRLLGQLRCIGVSRRQLFAAVLGEVALLGLVGGIAGLGAGVWLAQGLVGSVARTVSDLYAFVSADVAPLDTATAVGVLIGATVTAIVAGWVPATDAAATPPGRVGLASREESRFRRAVPRLIATGLASALAGVLLIALPTQSIWVGFLAAFAFLMAGASLLPVIMRLILRPLRARAERGGRVLLALAAGALDRSLHRAGGSAAALGVALSMTVAVIVMIGSFEREVRRWVGDILRADLYIAEENAGRALAQSAIPVEAQRIIAGIDGVASVESRRSLEVPFADRAVTVLGLDWRDPTAELEAKDLLETVDDVPAIFAAGGALVSEPLARKYGTGAGDILELPGRDGVCRFAVAAVYRDYARDSGVVVLSTETYVDNFGDTGIENLAVYVEEGGDVAAVAAAMRGALAESFLLRVRSNAELRREVLVIFDRTFRVTYVLQIIATVIALFGIAVTLVSLFLERSREIATLRAIGTPVSGIVRLFARESLLLASFPVALSIPLGALLAWVLIAIVNLRSFGWSIRYSWPVLSVATVLALALAAALLATLVPRALTRRQSIALALREE